eukprot:scaffold605_cov400-Prasinococcus_capsulatus_cf.AAC.12
MAQAQALRQRPGAAGGVLAAPPRCAPALAGTGRLQAGCVRAPPRRRASRGRAVCGSGSGGRQGLKARSLSAGEDDLAAQPLQLEAGLAEKLRAAHRDAARWEDKLKIIQHLAGPRGSLGPVRNACALIYLLWILDGTATSSEEQQQLAQMLADGGAGDPVLLRRRVRLGQQLQDVFRSLEWLRDDCSDVDWALGRQMQRLLPSVDGDLRPSAAVCGLRGGEGAGALADAVLASVDELASSLAEEGGDDRSTATQALALMRVPDWATVSTASLLEGLGALAALRSEVCAALAAGLRNDAPDDAMAMRQRFRKLELLLEEYLVSTLATLLLRPAEESSAARAQAMELLSQQASLSSLKSARALYPKPQSMIEQAKSRTSAVCLDARGQCSCTARPRPESRYALAGRRADTRTAEEVHAARLVDSAQNLADCTACLHVLFAQNVPLLADAVGLTSDESLVAQTSSLLSPPLLSSPALELLAPNDD